VTPREIAQAYLERGWVPVPLPFRSKRGGRGWDKRTLASARETLARDFGGKLQNTGILLGNPSGGLVDVDLDCPEAIDLAKDFLPPTRIFGRASKPASHWIYTCAPVETAKYSEPVDRGVKPAMLVELRATGCQTVFPGSVHECGEPIEWTDESNPIATIEPADLYKRVARLAVACLLIRHGMPREEAIETGMTDGEFLIDHPCTVTVRKWTGKTGRPKPAKKATGGRAANVDAAVDVFNRANCSTTITLPA
jgi:Bifunctional DNA primase/polymerase, N-terminal